MELIKYWPEILQNLYEFKQIANAEQPEFTQAAEDIENATNDFFIVTLSEDGCDRWESILGLTHSDGQTLDERREQIKIKFMSRLPYTYKVLLQYLASITDDYSVNLDNESYELFVSVKLSGYSQKTAMLAALAAMIPANLLLLAQCKFTETVQPATAIPCAGVTSLVQHEHIPVEMIGG